MKRLAFITGANKGIGFGTAKHLGLSGWSIIIGARNAQRAEAAIKKLKDLGVDVAGWVSVELSDPKSIEAAAKEISEKYPETNLLINNAGIPGDMSVTSAQTGMKELRETMEVNFFGTFSLTTAMLPVIGKNNGRIVNITVPSEVSPYWHPLAYVASKAAQNAFTSIIAMERTQGVDNPQIFSVHPGPTTTDLNGNMALTGFHTIENVGAEMAKLLNSDEDHNGQFIELYPIVPE